METLPISELPSLKKRLGKVGIARINAAMLDDSNFRKTRNTIQNTVINLMQFRGPRDNDAIADYISGLANNESHGQKPLNRGYIYILLQCLDCITTRHVMKVLDLGENQARRYVRACKQAIPYIEKHLNEGNLYEPELSIH